MPNPTRERLRGSGLSSRPHDGTALRYWLVVPAAGAGRRFGDSIPKQYADLHGRTVLEWALAPFLHDRRCAGIVVAIAADDAYWPALESRLTNTKGTDQRVSVETAPGGTERSHSVRNGLGALRGRAAAADWVLVHDAARPCVSRGDLDRLLRRGRDHSVGGLLAIPAADTLKRAASDRQVMETVDRAGLWRALTPQMFRYGKLCDGLDRALASGRAPTDEAQALEWLGERPLLIEGSTANIKITGPDDLVIAAALLAVRPEPLLESLPDVSGRGGRVT